MSEEIDTERRRFLGAAAATIAAAKLSVIGALQAQSGNTRVAPANVGGGSHAPPFGPIK